MEGIEVAEWLNSVGATGIILKYRVPEKRPEGDVNHFPPLEDAQRAISLVRSKASEWEIKPDRIGILGFSAGGHLTVLACTQYDHRAYEPIDDVDKVSCRPDFGIPIYPAWLEVEGKDELKSEFPVNKQTPPMFIACAADDRISAVGSAVLYAGHETCRRACRGPHLRQGRPRLWTSPQRQSLFHLARALRGLDAQPGIALIRNARHYIRGAARTISSICPLRYRFALLHQVTLNWWRTLSTFIASCARGFSRRGSALT